MGASVGVPEGCSTSASRALSGSLPPQLQSQQVRPHSGPRVQSVQQVQQFQSLQQVQPQSRLQSQQVQSFQVPASAGPPMNFGAKWCRCTGGIAWCGSSTLRTRGERPPTTMPRTTRRPTRYECGTTLFLTGARMSAAVVDGRWYPGGGGMSESVPVYPLNNLRTNTRLSATLFPTQCLQLLRIHVLAPWE